MTENTCRDFHYKSAVTNVNGSLIKVCGFPAVNSEVLNFNKAINKVGFVLRNEPVESVKVRESFSSINVNKSLIFFFQQ